MQGRVFTFLLLAAVACGSSDSNDTSSGGPDTPDAGPGLPGNPDDTFEVSVDDPSTTRMLTQTTTYELAVHVKRGPGIGLATLKVEGLPKDAVAANVVLPDGTADTKLLINVAATTPQGPATFKVRASSQGHADATADVKSFVRGTPGSLDTTFGGVGYLATPYTGVGDGYWLRVLPDNSIINTVPMLKASADGVVDTSYVTNSAGSGGFPFEVDTTGRVYWVSSSTGGPSQANGHIKRLLPNGMPDAAYSSTGLILDTYKTRLAWFGNKLRVLEMFYAASGVIRASQLNDDGTVDPTWGQASDHTCYPNQPETRNNVPQGAFTNGRIWATATGETVIVTAYGPSGGPPAGSSMVLCSADGATATVKHLDTTLPLYDAAQTKTGAAILVKSPPDTDHVQSDLYWTFIDSDGKHATNLGTPDGLVDSLIPWGPSVSPIDLQIIVDDQGRVLVGGQSGSAGSLDVTLTRFLPTGAIDKTFGNQGKVVTRVGTGVNDMRFGRIAFMSDGRIYVTASHFDSSNAAIIRYWN